MHPLHPLFSVIIFFVAFLTGFLIRQKYKIVALPAGRYESIDGMRGFLALFVFIHHCSLWYQYIQIGKWGGVKSNLYLRFGETSVAFFFMITSFLFISKLVNSKEKGINWRHFFLSRVYRLFPMYYFSIMSIIILLLCISQWQIKPELPEFLSALMKWGSFSIVPSATTNAKFKFLLNGGVEWSLAYEWFFYFGLPFISLFLLKTKPSKLCIFLSAVLIVSYFYLYGVSNMATYYFMAGGFAAILLKYTPVNRKIKDIYASIFIVLCLYLIVEFNMHNKIYLLLVASVFTLVAFGNTLFGVLRNATLKFLGDISYSTYLLHGIVLFLVFYFVLGIENTKRLSPLEFCFVVFSITPLVVLVSFLGFRYIEKPFMDKSKRKLTNADNNTTLSKSVQSPVLQS